MVYLKEGHQPLSAVIFDLGNVILDYAPYRFMFELGIPKELHDRIYAVTVNNPLWPELDRGTMSQEDFLADAIRREPLLKKEVTTYMKHWKERFFAIPENVAAMYLCKEAGAKTYVLSNFMKETYDYMIERNSFFKDFDGIVISAHVHMNKPEPGIYRHLIETYQLDPSTSVFFDDLPQNIEGAKNAGLLGVCLPPCAPVADYLEFE